jgi:hypothetical protein
MQKLFQFWINPDEIPNAAKVQNWSDIISRFSVLGMSMVKFSLWDRFSKVHLGRNSTYYEKMKFQCFGPMDDRRSFCRRKNRRILPRQNWSHWPPSSPIDVGRSPTVDGRKNNTEFCNGIMLHRHLCRFYLVTQVSAVLFSRTTSA